jgi:uncharacterized protein
MWIFYFISIYKAFKGFLIISKIQNLDIDLFIILVNMHVTFIPKLSQKETEWSGGTTTQLFIFPKETSYAERDFLFRISSANVKVEESIFTKLPGVSRAIMILEGELKIEHEGKNSIVLKKFDTDIFEGSWNTKAFGKCTDFNLMTTGNCKGNLQCIVLNLNQHFTKTLFTPENYIGYYLLKGEVEISVLDKKYILNQNDFILLESENKTEEFKIEATEYSELVEAEIYL